MMEEKQKVRVDWFIADVANVEIELSEELVGGLVEGAIEYLQANGSLRWEQWSLLSGASRAAFAEAGKQLKLREVLDVSK